MGGGGQVPVALAKEGRPDRNGVGPGCVRAAFESALGLQEEVTEFDPPSYMAYRIVRGGFPIKNHRGDVRFEPHARSTRIVVERRVRVPHPG